MAKITVTVGQLKKIIKEMHGADHVEQGDLVDVDLETLGRHTVRVIKLVPDVRHAAGLVPVGEDPSAPPWENEFDGPGFEAVVEEDGPEYRKGDRVVFALNQVVPGSKIKYYFPSDEYGRKIDEL